MAKQYNLILDDGQTVTVSADSHEISHSKISLYRNDSDGNSQLVGVYASLKGWQILEDQPHAF